MTRLRAQWLGLVALVVVALVVWPSAARLWLTAGSVLVLAVAAAEAFASARSLRAAHPSRFDALVPPGAPAERPHDLARCERMLGWRSYSPKDFRHRVAPVLTRVLTSRLAARGIDPHADPESARTAAGPAGPLLDAAGDDSGGPIDTAQISRMVDAIEAL